MELKFWNEKGSFSAYWMILILIVLGLMLFSREILNENVILSIEEREFLDKKIAIENLNEQTKLVGYLVMENAVLYSIDYIDRLPNRDSYSEEYLESVYRDRIKIYSSRSVNTVSPSGIGGVKEQDIAYIEGHFESYESAYEYDYGDGELLVEARDSSESARSDYRKYTVKYFLKSGETEIGHTLTPVYMIMEYPSYREAISGKLNTSCVKIIKGSSGEGAK